MATRTNEKCSMDSTAQQTNLMEHIEQLIQTIRKSSNTTLLDCPEKFSGEYGADKIERFINYIVAYKNVKNISNEQALMELPYLLVDHAYKWWQARRENIKCWPDALDKLRMRFSNVRPSHALYVDIFSKPNDDAVSLENFVDEKLELFAQLPQPHSTEMQLDILYGLLPAYMQTKIKRNDCTTMSQLKKHIKAVQETLEQKDSNGIDEKDEKDHEHNSQKLLKENPAKRNRFDLNETELIIVPDDREPFIKVRRTEDLMPLIKEEDEVVSVKSDEEFLDENDDEAKTNSLTVNRNRTPSPDFRIDNDLMNQISHIIKSCDIDISLQAPADKVTETEYIKTVEEPPIMTTIEITTPEKLIPPKTVPTAGFARSLSITKHGDKTSTSTQQNSAPKVNPKKKRSRLRCRFCLTGGHVTNDCFKRKQLLKQKQNQADRNNAKKIRNHAAATTTAPIAAQTSTVTTDIVAIPPLRYTTAFYSASPEAQLAMTTKSISKPEVPATAAKTIVSKLKASFSPTVTNSSANNSSSPSPKCHQCGTVGYYRSICPNCSPIYFYKPPNNINR